MAEPARKKIYDDEDENKSLTASERADKRWGTSSSTPSSSEGGEKTTQSSPARSAREKANERWGMAPEDLQAAEQSADKPENQRDNKAGTEESDKLGKGFTEEGAGKSGKKRKFKLTRKRTAGGITALLLLGGGGFAGFTFLQGPFQLISLSQLLTKPTNYMSDSTNTRTKGFLKWYRYSQTGDIGETRVSILGSKRFGNVVDQLESKGIRFERNQNGRPTRMTIDASKADSLRGSSLSETRNNIARHYNVPIERISQTSGLNGGKFVIDTKGINAKNTRLLANSTLSVLDSGKIQTAMNKRVIAKFWNAPSLFHPMQKGAADLQNRWDTRQAKKAAEKERKESKRATLSAKYTNAKNRIASKLGPASGVFSGALTLTGGLCILKSVSEILPLANYAHVVTPAMEEAIDKEAVGAQVQAQDDFDISQPDAVSESLVDDEGGTVWQAAGIKALESGTSDPGDGEEIRSEYKQAFVYEGGGIEALIISLGAESISEATGEDLDNIADKACSPLGLIIQGIISGALIVIGPGGWIVKGVQAGSSMAAIAGIMYFLSSMVEENLAEDFVEEFAGPQGGNLMAYGARAAANLNATSMGGVALNSSDELALQQEFEKQEHEEFSQKNFFARMFDVQDYRSVASTVLRSTPTQPTQGFKSIASTIMNPIQSLSGSVSSIFTSQVSAAEPYNWGFPIYSIPPNILEDPKFENPYQNAEEAAKILDDGDDKYKERAEKCFGVQLLRGTDGWEALQEVPINPLEDEYQEQDCDDMGDDNWVRIMLFVFDNAIVNTVDCFEGGTESCQRIGTGGGSPGGGGDGEVIDGFAFPLDATKGNIGNANIFSNGTTDLAGHPYTAYDILAPVGTTVVAATGGEVSSVNQSSQPCGDGRVALSVQVYDKTNDRTYFYQHMAPGSQQVSQGQTVTPGTPLGKLGEGATHCNTVPHLHIDASRGTTRPACRRGSCSSAAKAKFVDIGPSLYQTFETLSD